GLHRLALPLCGRDDEPADLLDLARQRRLGRVVQVQQSPIGEILVPCQVPGAPGVVADMERVEIHPSALSRGRSAPARDVRMVATIAILPPTPCDSLRCRCAARSCPWPGFSRPAGKDRAGPR